MRALFHSGGAAKRPALAHFRPPASAPVGFSGGESLSTTAAEDFQSADLESAAIPPRIEFFELLDVYILLVLFGSAFILA